MRVTFSLSLSALLHEWKYAVLHRTPLILTPSEHRKFSMPTPLRRTQTVRASFGCGERPLCTAAQEDAHIIICNQQAAVSSALLYRRTRSDSKNTNTRRGKMCVRRKRQNKLCFCEQFVHTPQVYERLLEASWANVQGAGWSMGK